MGATAKDVKIETTWRFPSDSIKAEYFRLLDVVAGEQSPVEKPRPPLRHPNCMTLVLNGKGYESVRQASVDTGIAKNRITEQIRHSNSKDIKLPVTVSPDLINKEGPTPCCVNGVDYQSYEAAAEALKARPYAIKLRAISAGSNTFSYIPPHLRAKPMKRVNAFKIKPETRRQTMEYGNAQRA